MSQGNNESNAMGLALGIVGAAIIMMFAVIFMIAAFVTFLLTILCLFSWNKPLQIGKFVMVPEESRAFVKRGLAGAIILPAFAVFIEVFFGINLNWDYLSYMIGGGYVLGSLGLEILLADNEEAAPAQQIVIPQPSLPAPPRQSLPRPQPENFRFATWDDEEGKRNREGKDDQQ